MASKEDNPVGFLLELCQKHGYAFPQFEEVDDSGPDHEKMFTVKCKFQNVEALGKARTKKAAKSEAAKNMILVSLDKCSVETRKEDSIADSSEKTSPVGNKNPVSMLNEFSQKKGLRPPKFEVVSSVSGFVSTCSLEGNTTYGHGDNKKSAKTESANKMCILLKLRHEKDTLSIDKDDANLVVEVENQSNLAEYEEPDRYVVKHSLLSLYSQLVSKTGSRMITKKAQSSHDTRIWYLVGCLTTTLVKVDYLSQTTHCPYCAAT